MKLMKLELYAQDEGAGVFYKLDLEEWVPEETDLHAWAKEMVDTNLWARERREIVKKADQSAKQDLTLESIRRGPQ